MITVFTPVYNRVHTIGKLYQSLLRQTDFDFEWLIVDDGSEDGISELVHKWLQEGNASFPIRFYQQKNGGKHRAVNLGVELAKGDAFFIVDSDDYITEDAISFIKKWWGAVAEDSKFAGISGLRRKENGKIIGDMPSFAPFVDATNIEREKYGLTGDKAEIYKTSVLKKYPFPEFEGENFLTEAVVWDKIAHAGLKIRWLNQAITVCEYREDGLTSQGRELFIRNPKGWGFYIYQTGLFYQLSDRDRIQEYFRYYIDLKNEISHSEIKRNLRIDEKTLTKLRQLHKHYIKKTVDKIGTKIALYGGGNRGKRILNLYQGSEVEIRYILDRKKVDLPYLQIHLNEDYPFVDAIIVTPKNGQAEIIDFLRKRTKHRLISYSEWEMLVDGR